MDMQLKEEFVRTWHKYFNNIELPITFYYTDEEGHADLVKPGTEARCIIGPLIKVRRGVSFTFNAESVGCWGGKSFLGFSDNDVLSTDSDSEYFLSYGIPGKVEGDLLVRIAALEVRASQVANAV